MGQKKEEGEKTQSKFQEEVIMLEIKPSYIRSCYLMWFIYK